jgi:hypothetical protein
VRFALLSFPLAVFFYYAWKDNAFHFRKPPVGDLDVPGSPPQAWRLVTRGEHLLHGVLGLLLAGLISAAFRLDPVRLPLFAGLFALAGAADEFGYHRKLPAEEADLHAKEHLSLMLFLLAAWVTA